MPRSHPPYPAEYRQQMVALVRTGRKTSRGLVRPGEQRRAGALFGFVRANQALFPVRMPCRLRGVSPRGPGPGRCGLERVGAGHPRPLPGGPMGYRRCTPGSPHKARRWAARCATPTRALPQTGWRVTSAHGPRTDWGWPTSPPSPPGRGSWISPRWWMPSAAGWSAGPGPAIGAPS
jgi:hypothetical protein